MKRFKVDDIVTVRKEYGFGTATVFGRIIEVTAINYRVKLIRSGSELKVYFGLDELLPTIKPIEIKGKASAGLRGIFISVELKNFF